MLYGRTGLRGARFGWGPEGLVAVVWKTVRPFGPCVIVVLVVAALAMVGIARLFLLPFERHTIILAAAGQARSTMAKITNIETIGAVSFWFSFLYDIRWGSMTAMEYVFVWEMLFLQ